MSHVEKCFVGTILLLSSCVELTDRQQDEMQAIEDEVSEIYGEDAKIQARQRIRDAATHRVVSKANYDRIQTGMSYHDVARIIGTDGEEMSSNRIEGVPGVMESIETIMYVWKNGDGTNMSVIFQNDKLFQKSQFGLK